MKKISLGSIWESPSMPGYILILIAVLLNILVQGAGFFSPWNFSTVLNSATPLILVSIAQLITILAGGIDLSVGASMALVNAVAIVCANSFGMPIWQSWLLATATGIIIGFFNGLVVAYLRLPPFLATFATSSIVQGTALLVLPTPGGTVPREIYSRYGGFTIGLPTPLFIIVGAVLLWIYIDHSRLGVRIRAVGGNPRNAFLSNIKPERIKLAAFTIAGFFTSMAGLCLTAFTASGDPWIGVPYSLKSMATVILGGCLFDSGWGNVGGAVSGSLFFIIVSNIVFFAFGKLQTLFPDFSVSTFYQDFATNLIIVFGLVSSVFFKKLRLPALRNQEE